MTVAVSLDGVMVPMKDAKRADGSAGYQEAGCGTLTYYDAEGERLDTLYWGRMPQPHKVALKRTLGAELEVVLGKRPGPARGDDCRRGARQLALSRYVSGAGDGGGGLLPRGRAPEVGLDACYGQGNAKGRAHYEKLRHLLRHDCAGVEKVIRSLNHLRRTRPGNKRIAEVLGDLRNNRHRMGYAEAKAQNLPIGSGWWRRRARLW